MRHSVHGTALAAKVIRLHFSLDKLPLHCGGEQAHAYGKGITTALQSSFKISKSQP